MKNFDIKLISFGNKENCISVKVNGINFDVKLEPDKYVDIAFGMILNPQTQIYHVEKVTIEHVLKDQKMLRLLKLKKLEI